MATKREWLNGRTDQGKALPAHKVAAYRAAHNIQAMEAAGADTKSELYPVPPAAGTEINSRLRTLKLPELNKQTATYLDSFAASQTQERFRAARKALTALGVELPQRDGTPREHAALLTMFLNDITRTLQQRENMKEIVQATGNSTHGLFCSCCGRPKSKRVKLAVKPGSLDALAKLGVQVSFTSPEAEAQAAALSRG